jgi:methionine synthase II (cobalamin-independent)
MAPLFRAEQIGSLLRPTALLEARSHPENTTSLSEVTRRSVSTIVKQQLHHNVRPITDGEFQRFIFYGGFFDHIAGFENSVLSVPNPAYRTNYPSTEKLLELGIKERPIEICTGKVAWKEPPYLDEWELLKSVLPDPKLASQCKITMPALTYWHLALKPEFYYPHEVYSTDDEFFADLTAVYRRAICTLYDAGVRNIQIDDPTATFLCV